MSYFVKEIFYTLSTIERKTIGLSELVMRSRPSFFASSHAFGVALLKAESRSSSGAIIERSAPRTSEGVGDEGGLIWGSKLVGGNQIVKNKDFPPNHVRPKERVD
ncbi:MAG: hypothetical protein NTX30_07155 [Deltaproteobacteria bacterium]|nr:hypothetical protein [Deltaproteobacteria bacterium]